MCMVPHFCGLNWRPSHSATSTALSKSDRSPSGFLRWWSSHLHTPRCWQLLHGGGDINPVSGQVLTRLPRVIGSIARLRMMELSEHHYFTPDFMTTGSVGPSDVIVLVRAISYRSMNTSSICSGRPYRRRGPHIICGCGTEPKAFARSCEATHTSSRTS